MTTQGEIRGIPLALFIVILAFVILMSVVLMSVRGMVERPKELSDAYSESPHRMLSPDFSLFRIGREVSGMPPAFGETLVEVKEAYRAKDYWKAEDFLRTLLLYYPESPTILKMLGDLFYQKGEYANAEYYYRKRLEMDSSDALVLNNLAMTQGKRGNFVEAIRNMRTVLRLKPDLPEAEWNLAGLFMQAGRKEEALPHLKTALKKTGKVIHSMELDDVFLPLLDEPEIRDMIDRTPLNSENVHE